MVARTSLLDQVINSSQGMPPELARYLLSLSFPPAAQARYDELSEKSQDGTLSPAERAELEEFVNVGTFLTIMQSKARLTLRPPPSSHG